MWVRRNKLAHTGHCFTTARIKAACKLQPRSGPQAARRPSEVKNGSRVRALIFLSLLALFPLSLSCTTTRRRPPPPPGSAVSWGSASCLDQFEALDLGAASLSPAPGSSSPVPPTPSSVAAAGVDATAAPATSTGTGIPSSAGNASGAVFTSCIESKSPPPAGLGGRNVDINARLLQHVRAQWEREEAADTAAAGAPISATAPPAACNAVPNSAALDSPTKPVADRDPVGMTDSDRATTPSADEGGGGTASSSGAEGQSLPGVPTGAAMPPLPRPTGPSTGPPRPPRRGSVIIGPGEITCPALDAPDAAAVATATTTGVGPPPTSGASSVLTATAAMPFTPSPDDIAGARPSANPSPSPPQHARPPNMRARPRPAMQPHRGTPLHGAHRPTVVSDLTPVLPAVSAGATQTTTESSSQEGTASTAVASDSSATAVTAVVEAASLSPRSQAVGPATRMQVRSDATSGQAVPRGPAPAGGGGGSAVLRLTPARLELPAPPAPVGIVATGATSNTPEKAQLPPLPYPSISASPESSTTLIVVGSSSAGGGASTSPPSPGLPPPPPPAPVVSSPSAPPHAAPSLPATRRSERSWSFPRGHGPLEGAARLTLAGGFGGTGFLLARGRPGAALMALPAADGTARERPAA